MTILSKAAKPARRSLSVLAIAACAALTAPLGCSSSSSSDGGSGNDGGSEGGGGNDAGGGGFARSGVTGSKKTADLTDTERKQICDWAAGLFGGYGKKRTVQCASGSAQVVAGPSEAAQCVSIVMTTGSCNGTAAQLEDCLHDDATTFDPCKGGLAPSSCDPFVTCFLGAPFGG